MPRPPAALTVLACLGFVTGPSVEAAPRWFLMSRHGECVELGTLKRKVPDLGGIDDPQAFAAFMRQKGHQVTSQEASVPAGRAYEVRVPDRDLFLMFVTSEMCGRS